MSQRLNITVSNGMYEHLVSIADKEDISLTELVRKAIASEIFFRMVQDEGKRVLIHDEENNRWTEVVFR